MAEIVGGGTPDSSNADYWDGDIDWYTPSEIGESRSVQTSAKKITREGLDHSSARLLPAGSILFTSRASIGLMAFISRPSATNQGFQSLVPSNNVDSNFLYALGPYISRYAKKHAAGSTFIEISGSSLAKAPLRIPSLAEQCRIGTFFSKLDSLIAAAERQEDLLKQKKQAYLQLMFPQGGENEPRLRFAGFSGEWEQRRFGEIFQYERPDAYLAGDDEIEDEGAIPVLTANKAFILGYTNSFQGIYQKGRCIIFDDFTLDSKRVEHPFKVRSSAIKILTVRENMDFDFAFELLRTSKFPLLGHARHYITVVQPQAALIPHSLQEQQHIGRFFRNFDSLIAAAEKRAASLRALKSAYLQRMFV